MRWPLPCCSDAKEKKALQYHPKGLSQNNLQERKFLQGSPYYQRGWVMRMCRYIVDHNGNYMTKRSVLQQYITLQQM